MININRCIFAGKIAKIENRTIKTTGEEFICFTLAVRKEYSSAQEKIDIFVDDFCKEEYLSQLDEQPVVGNMMYCEASYENFYVTVNGEEKSYILLRAKMIQIAKDEYVRSFSKEQEKISESKTSEQPATPKEELKYTKKYSSRKELWESLLNKK